MSSTRAPTTRMSVSVVIPTVGRPELRAAVESALAQSYPVLEVLVCLDSDKDLGTISLDPRVQVLHTGPNRGGNAARQAGIEAASGELVALLDDDDTWAPEKIGTQLEEVRRRAPIGDAWIATSRLVAVIEGEGEEIWPRDLMTESERLGPYIFRKHRPVGGQGFVQASTLLFPRGLALRHPFDPTRRFHQDVAWLNLVDQAEPSLVVVQSADALTRYAVGASSVSKAIDPRLSLEWAQENIVDDPRSLGDFILTTVVIYASRRGRPIEVLRMIREGYRCGRPGVPALVFAGYRFLSSLRIRYARLLPFTPPAT